MRRKGQERVALRVTPTAADDDEASERATQLHGQDALWLAGAARQARADAHAHQVAAGQASGAKRKANAMTSEERLAKRAADEKRRWHERKAAQAAAERGDAEAVAAIEAAQRAADEALEEELQQELKERIIERHGPWLMDTHTLETASSSSCGWRALAPTAATMDGRSTRCRTPSCNAGWQMAR